ncbi:MAG TPA: Uma2 family endonuclease [Actinocrinis sp.]|nr:Uma2 family endonuclease [Actinocrinis sp.]
MQKLFSVAEATRDDFRWELTQGNGLDLAGSSDGYIPDLLCVSSDTYASLVAQKPVKVPAEYAALVVEITSPSNAAEGRKPGPKRERPTTWSGYAREGIPHYLLIDRDPKVLKAILYSDPDRTTGKYRASTAWPFGKRIDLPDPFGIEIPTATWQPWTA